MQNTSSPFRHQTFRASTVYSRNFENMTDFQTVRDMVLISYNHGYISEGKLLILLNEYSSKNPAFSYHEYGRFDIDNVNEPECKHNFTMEKRHISLLVDVL